jgi:hypothetical protein
MAQKTLYRTRIVVEVLSEEPIGDVDMDTILNETRDGGWSGKNVTTEQDKPISGEEAVKAVQEHGTDTEFFNMDENGEEIVEEWGDESF